MSMDNKFINARTSVYNTNYHVVWCVKFREELINKELEEEILDSFKRISKEKGFTITNIYIEDRNIVQCFLNIPPKISLTDAVKYLKGISARHIFMFHPELEEKKKRDGDFWNRSYFAETLGEINEEEARKYLEKQKMDKR